jgi:hypothetical protein
MTLGQVVDQVIDYSRDSPAAEFFRNLGQEVRENRMPSGSALSHAASHRHCGRTRSNSASPQRDAAIASQQIRNDHGIPERAA